MSIDDKFRHLRGVVRNALVWGIGWGAIVFAGVTILDITGILPEGLSWLDGLVLGAKAGVVGVVAGGAFSSVLRFLYRGKRLSEISWVRFGIGGGVITGVFVPALLQTMNLLSGDGLVPWALVLDDGLWTGVLGAVLAGGSLKLAQRADPALHGGNQDELDRPDHLDRLPAAEARDMSLAQRSRSAERTGSTRRDI
jgi:hypothetical protein